MIEHSRERRGRFGHEISAQAAPRVGELFGTAHGGGEFCGLSEGLRSPILPRFGDGLQNLCETRQAQTTLAAASRCRRSTVRGPESGTSTSASQVDRLLTPGKPIHRIVLRLEQVGTRFVRKPLSHGWLLWRPTKDERP